MGYMTCTLNARGIYTSPRYLQELWVSFVFCFSLQQRLHLRATSGRILMYLFFRRHGNTRVLDMPFFTQSNIFEHNDFKLFQVEVTSVTSVQRSEWNVTETVALLFSRLDYTRLKGKIQLDFKPFYFV